MKKFKTESMEKKNVKRRLLVKLIVQPVYVDLDENDSPTEVAAQAMPIPASKIQEYVSELLEYAKRAKQGEIDLPK